MIRVLAFLTLCLFVLISFPSVPLKGKEPNLKFIGAADKRIQYTGRIDFSDPKKPRFWSPGVYIKARFRGPYCEVVLNDEELWGNSHNYLEIVIDDKPPLRIQTRGKTNRFVVAQGLPAGEHSITICKNTEAGIGYLELVGFRCEDLVPLTATPARKLEFIGDSITCGAGSDLSKSACGKGQWYDQHNAYLSYGPTTARQLNARWQVTAVSGIGLVHSCCDMKLTMPDVFDKTNLRENSGPWDFRRYQPDAVTICLGQNDGTRDPQVFRETYINFIKKIRSVYPQAHIICLTSPMADENLTAFMKENLTQVVAHVNEGGDRKVHKYFFSKRYNHGCGGHPDLSDHRMIANELSAFLKSTLKW
ncbi:MAG TPA: SGNH/GDSL hydrolase family protein [Abditibacteriaceae bacterium]|jgi:lysophospholipase L1-like esterase